MASKWGQLRQDILVVEGEVSRELQGIMREVHLLAERLSALDLALEALYEAHGALSRGRTGWARGSLESARRDVRRAVTVREKGRPAGH